MLLTDAQREQLKKQLALHDRASGMQSIELSDGVRLDLFIERGVFGSDIMSSGLYLARFLYKRQDLYRGRACLDMGCGPGTQGLVMGSYGAASVVFADVSEKAIDDTKRNVELHRLTHATAYVSDLFSGLPVNQRYDVIVFNHPFFPERAERFEDDPMHDIELQRTMLGGTALVRRFFSGAGSFLNKNGILIMPYFYFAGPENDPRTHAGRAGFAIREDEKIQSTTGLQRGEISISVFTR